MREVKYIVFRYLTHADFFNMYKPPGMETRGGGQSYIDFPITTVSSANWSDFFSGVPSTSRAKGPRWAFDISSVGLQGSQSLVVFQRRAQSFSISSQKITSSSSNRVLAWHPLHGFPQPTDPANRTSCPRNLAIYMVRTDTAEFWAGWFLNTAPCRDSLAKQILLDMLPASPTGGLAGFLAPGRPLYMDESDRHKPFFTMLTQPTAPQSGEADSAGTGLSPGSSADPTVSRSTPRTEDDLVASLFDEDESQILHPEGTTREVVTRVRNRNAKAVRGLKELYRGRCQISADEYTFLKRDGTPYSEAHHLTPLGEEGADSPFNIIIINPLIHRMLHYADVSGIDLSLIGPDNALGIVINSKAYTIRWHPKHAEYVKSHREDND